MWMEESLGLRLAVAMATHSEWLSRRASGFDLSSSTILAGKHMVSRWDRWDSGIGPLAHYRTEVAGGLLTLAPLETM